MKHRIFSKRYVRSFFVSCLIFLFICSIGFATGQQKIFQDNDTAVLSFPASDIWSEQLETRLSMRLLELLPTQEVTNTSAEPLMLLPGGQPVGILLRTDGILVVGYSPVETHNASVQPAEDAGIQAGDTIISINNTPIIHDDELAQMVHQLGMQGETVTLELVRQNRTLTRTVKPVYCQQTKTYRIGLLIRDNAGGVGTLTFVNPRTMQYGALGHMIANSETQRKLNILNGKLVAADIQGIKKGTAGVPGEKIGRFVSDDPLGNIAQNTAAGIFGTLSNQSILSRTITTTPIPAAHSSEICIGPAIIYTALDGTEVKSYAIEIEKVNTTNRDGKNLVVRITDPALLKRTGGIIQGMSGSPIIQDGKLVGAVTHVLVNDPTRGYGIFIENMLDAAG